MDTFTIETEKPSKKNLICFLICVLVFAGITVLVTVASFMAGWEPSGGDVWGHLYKSKFMYENILEGNFYPLYTDDWYNGIQLYRYWPPMAYYIMAALMFFTGGDVLNAYYLFIGFVFFVGAFPFLLFGKDNERPFLGLFLAVLFFFLPDNIRVFFCEGNMPRITTAVVTPYVLYFLWKYMRQDKKGYLIPLMFSMSVLTLSHLMITAITGIGTFLFLCFHCFTNRNPKKCITALIFMVLGIMISGIWFIPALSGGMLAMGDSSSGVQSLLTFPLWVSLNPLNRVSGSADIYYFGISILLVCVFGIFLAQTKKKAGFFLAVLVLLGTTPATLTITEHLPLGDFFWMTRFTAFAYACMFLSLLEWTTLKKRYLAIAVGLLFIDSIVTVFCIPRYAEFAPEAAKNDTALLKEHTTQRANNIDLSHYGCYASFELLNGDDAVDYTYGWAWQGAVTADNIMLLNEALEAEEYLYIFDRSIELGNDAVLFMKVHVKDEDKLMKEAERLGFYLVEESASGYVFKKDTPESFGVKTTYEGLAIGTYSKTVTLYYPLFTTGPSAYIDDYTVEELTKYKTVFLSGFEYHNKDAAENLLRQAGAAGTRIVIDAAHFPENPLMQNEFMGLYASRITFDNIIPNLSFNDETIISGKVPAGEGAWQTAYVSTLDHISGSLTDKNQVIPFFGYNEADENIYYLGLNLFHLALSTNNADLWAMLAECFDIPYNEAPERTLVPMTITRDGNTITIHSEEGNVNTTLAYQDIFQADKAIYEENNLLFVEECDTVITMQYPKFWLGLLVSVLGLALGGFLFAYICRQERIIKQNPANGEE
ncbi:MAG: hypothetical protein IJ291_02635 [Lachnospiraceae bacterium]|nr:hypothetical protein [Lachnospiraceae bacterium]